MGKYGIESKINVLVDQKIKSQIHDRWIISEHICYNVPSGDVIKRGQYSELKETENTIPFDEWWSMGISLIRDWSIIKVAKENKKEKPQPTSTLPYSATVRKIERKRFQEII
jgi:hypothetical protein